MKDHLVDLVDAGINLTEMDSKHVHEKPESKLKITI